MDARAKKRAAQVDALVDGLAIDDANAYHGEHDFSPVCIVMAAYKEKDNIAHVVEHLPKQLCGLETTAIVVVDGEDDGTGAIAREHGAYTLIAPVNRGQGAALRLGYHVALAHRAAYIVTCDADGQTDPADLETCLAPVVAGEADFVNGSRRLGSTHNTDTVRNVGVVVYSSLISLLTRTAITDSANPIRAMRAEVVAGLTLEEPQYQASEVLISAIMSGARVLERPVTMRERASGSSKKGSNLRYGYRYGKVLLRTFAREQRKKLGRS
jgi:glycosyltransferase involved in cell wall biosynthesis